MAWECFHEAITSGFLHGFYLIRRKTSMVSKYILTWFRMICVSILFKEKDWSLSRNVTCMGIEICQYFTNPQLYRGRTLTLGEADRAGIEFQLYYYPFSLLRSCTVSWTLLGPLGKKCLLDRHGMIFKYINLREGLSIVPNRHWACRNVINGYKVKGIDLGQCRTVSSGKWLLLR